MEKERNAGNLELVGGRLCLDFVNTVSSRDEAEGREYLNQYQDLVAWARHAQICTDREAAGLLDRAARYPGQAATALGQAVALRETIYRILAATIEGRAAARRDLVALNAALREASSRLALTPSANRFEWTWVPDEDRLDQILWPIVRSAADLMTSMDLGRVRQCAREGCDWLFIDLSKNQSRRWCTMNVCGSRVKSRRYYHRKKQAG